MNKSAVLEFDVTVKNGLIKLPPSAMAKHFAANTLFHIRMVPILKANSEKLFTATRLRTRGVRIDRNEANAR